MLLFQLTFFGRLATQFAVATQQTVAMTLLGNPKGRSPLMPSAVLLDDLKAS
jgi:hypothetical protein